MSEYNTPELNCACCGRASDTLVCGLDFMTMARHLNGLSGAGVRFECIKNASGELDLESVREWRRKVRARIDAVLATHEETE